MKVLGWFVLLAVLLLAFFAIANWSLITAPASLNLLAFHVQAPLGLILFGATLLFAALFALYVLSLRTAALIDARRHMRELEVQRELADEAEASRFTALSRQVDEELARTRAELDRARQEILQRTDVLEQKLVQSLSETSNTLSAYVGELDDKLDRLSVRR